MNQIFEAIVVGGGHAGIEASHAAAKMGITTCLLSMNRSAIGRMSCNPAIGGVAKGQMVRDIDALGGMMGVLADQAGIQFRMLNASKGPAVWGPRAQQDMDLYERLASELMPQVPNLSVYEGLVEVLTPPDKSSQKGYWELQLKDGTTLWGKSVVITAGTFMDAIMYTGLTGIEGGRIHEPSAKGLSQELKNLDIHLIRLKTGTPARLKADSLDYNKVEIQYGDADPFAFSFRTQFELKNTATCWITRTLPETHKILSSGFDQSPMFTGKIKGLGPRYCPSIEDKISRFSERDSHQLFLEPEGVQSGRIYVNGFSSSLPAVIQEAALRSIPGLEQCEILRFGYAVEYDAVISSQMYPTLEMKNHPGLYFAGQVNGTSGYEEAAAQGLIAGINLALKLKGKDPFIPGRADSYIGVMIDDLVHLEMTEPYRMFTSRAEYRLFLRQDNAEQRLMKKGREFGLIDDLTWDRFCERESLLERSRTYLNNVKVKPEMVNDYLESCETPPLKDSIKGALALVKRPQVKFPEILKRVNFPEELDKNTELTLYSDLIYSGFYERQEKDINRLRKMENFKIPPDFDFEVVQSVSKEARIKMKAFRPLTLGHAQKIAGVRPSDISALIYWFESRYSKKDSTSSVKSDL